MSNFGRSCSSTCAARHEVVKTVEVKLHALVRCVSVSRFGYFNHREGALDIHSYKEAGSVSELVWRWRRRESNPARGQ